MVILQSFDQLVRKPLRGTQLEYLVFQQGHLLGTSGVTKTLVALDATGRAVDLQPAVGEAAIVLISRILQCQFNRLTQQMRPTLLRCAEVIINRRMVADDDAGKT